MPRWPDDPIPPHGGLAFREAFAPDSALAVVAHLVNDRGLDIDRICLAAERRGLFL